MVHTQAGANTRGSTHKSAYSHRTTHVIEGGGGVRLVAPTLSVACRSVGRVGSCTWDSTRVGSAHI